MRIIKISKGFSDANILNAMLAKLETKIDKILSTKKRAGSFSTKLTTNKKDKNNKPIVVNVKVVMSPKIKTEVLENNNNYLILIDSNFTRDEIFIYMAHEVTHISQYYNGLMSYETEEYQKTLDEKIEKYKNLLQESKFDEKDIEDRTRYKLHSERLSEQDAVLAEIAVTIKREQYHLLPEMLQNRLDYIKNIDNRKFMKALEQAGCTNTNLFQAKTTIKKNLNDFISYLNNNDIHTLIRFVKYINGISNMLNLNLNYYLDIVNKKAQELIKQE